MQIRPPLTLRMSAVATDGGTMLLQVRDTENEEHAIRLMQYAFLDADHEDGIPGRLYWGDDVVPIRSPEEASLLAALNDPDVDLEMPDDFDPADLDGSLGEVEQELRGFATAIHDFVASEHYLEIAKRVDARS